MSVICADCGHHSRLRDAEGRCTASGCCCALFAPSADAQQAEDATEAARVRQVERQRLMGTLRTAVARQRWDEALGACMALMALERGQ